jgi:hypothetical protein
MAKMTMGNRKSSKGLITQKLKALKYASLDEVLGMLPLEQMRKDIEDLKNKPQVMEIQPSERIVEHHVKTVNVTHENTKTIDKRARNYAKSLRSECNQAYELLVAKIDDLSQKLEQVEARKPEEKQILTVETRTVETVKEIEYKLDKRVLAALGASLLINILILILK